MKEVLEENISSNQEVFNNCIGEDESAIGKIESALKDFVGVCDEELKGKTYKALQEYFSSVIDVILAKRLEINQKLREVLALTTNGYYPKWNEFLKEKPKVTKIDTLYNFKGNIPDGLLHYENAKTGYDYYYVRANAYREYLERKPVKTTVVKNEKTGKNETISEPMSFYEATGGIYGHADNRIYSTWQIGVTFYKSVMDKSDTILEVDAGIWKLLDDAKATIAEYNNIVNSLNSSPLGFGAENPLITQPEEEPEENPNPTGTATPFSPGYSNAGGGGGGAGGGAGGETGGEGTQQPETNRERTAEEINKAIEESTKTMVATAASMIGKTATQMSEDPENVFYDSNYNYKEGEKWSTKFVTDMILREDELAGALDDYFGNPTVFKEPFTSSKDMMDYAIEDGSNIDYNWSMASVDKINEFTGAEPLAPGEARADYIPKDGDIVFFDSEEEGVDFNGDAKNTNTVGKLGIVESMESYVNEEGKTKFRINVIMGDTPVEGKENPIVERKQIELTDESILGFGTIKENGSNITKIGERSQIEPEPETPEPETPEPEVPEPIQEDPEGIRLAEGDSFNPNASEGTIIDDKGNVLTPDESGKYVQDESNKIDVTQDEEGYKVIEDDVKVTPVEPEGEKIPDSSTVDLPEDMDEINSGLVEWDFDDIN